MEEKEEAHVKNNLSSSFKVGAIALVFLIIGYEVALFVREAAVNRIIANRDNPDTVFVYLPAEMSATPAADGTSATSVASTVYSNSHSTSRKKSGHSPEAEKIFRSNAPRRYESFDFNPNTATVDDLMRLGLSEKQAASIDSYRKKGGKFRRKADFAKSYVISDSLYRRLEQYIFIPKLDINSADSAAFDELPGIGPYFASKMVWYRDKLHGYSYPEQLMEIWKLDSLKFAGLSDLIDVGPSEPYPIWTLPKDSLRRHPYISPASADGIVLFREHTPRAQWSMEAMCSAGIFPAEDADRLLRCRMAEPQ